MIYKLKVTKKDEYEERLYLVPQTGELNIISPHIHLF
jgi:hypothetical protein